MKKKLLTTLIAITMATTCALSFTACGKDAEGSGDDGWGNTYTVETAYAHAKDLGYDGTLEQFIASISGKDGVGITETLINSDGELVIVLSNGTTKNLGKINGADGRDGKDGVSVKNSYINDDGDLILEFTDGTTINCGRVMQDFQQLQYRAVEVNGEIIGYSVVGIGTVLDLDIVIPSTYKGKPVIAIADYGFYQGLEEQKITSITIPDSVTYIGTGAFSGSYGLKNLIIPDSVTYIGRHAFRDVDSMQYNEYGNALYIGNPNNPYLVLVKAASKNITSCTINEKTRFIRESAFYGCSSLERVEIPNGVTTIGESAFYGCSSLTSVTIPDSVTCIQQLVFAQCINLSDIYYNGTRERWGRVEKDKQWDDYIESDYTLHFIDD